MKVRDVMTELAVCCNPATNVGAAVELLWSCNFGMLPVVGPDNRLIGVVTDRDNRRIYLQGLGHHGGKASAPPACCQRRRRASGFVQWTTSLRAEI
jgi:CBS-domain-containing membrane protein